MSLIDLPPELISIIIRDYDLSFKDKLNCKLVSKLFNSIVNQLKGECLLVSNQICVNKTWFYSDKWINNKDQIFSDLNYDFIPELQAKTTFSNLKKLFIQISTFEDELDFDKSINRFEQLEQLELNRVNIKQNCELRLPNLQIFSLSTISNDKTIKLITPKLKALRTIFRDMDYEFVYPETIKYLVSDECCSMIFKNFLNLEILISKKFNEIDVATILNLKKLKELHNIGYSVFGFNDINLFHQLYEAKQNELFKFELFISGLNFEIFRQTAQNNFSSIITPFYSRNYDRLIPKLNWEEKFVFNKFEFNQRIPDDFFTKFPNLKYVLCEKTKDEELFLNFLTNCIYLDNLHLDLTVISPTNYIRLADCCPYLTCLEIFIREPINLDFIFLFKYLNRFSIDQTVRFKFISLAFKNLNYLQYFQFDFNQNTNNDLCFAVIQKATKNGFRLSYKDYNQNDLMSLEQIFDVLKKEITNEKLKT